MHAFGRLCLPSLNLCLTLFHPSMSRIVYCACISLTSIPLSPSFTKLLSGMLGIIGSFRCLFSFFLVFLSIDSHLSPLLLFAMFSIAARYDTPIMYSLLLLPQNPVPSLLLLSQQTVLPHGPPAKITSTQPSSSFNPVLPLHVQPLAKPSFS